MLLLSGHSLPEKAMATLITLALPLGEMLFEDTAHLDRNALNAPLRACNLDAAVQALRYIERKPHHWLFLLGGLSRHPSGLLFEVSGLGFLFDDDSFAHG